MEQVKVGLEVLHHLVRMLLHMVEKEVEDVIMEVLAHHLVKNPHIEMVEMVVVLLALEVVKAVVMDTVVTVLFMSVVQVILQLSSLVEVEHMLVVAVLMVLVMEPLELC